MEGRQRRSFTDDYKRQAVDLVVSSGRSIGSVARELQSGHETDALHTA
ncbi:transposase (plasmid) [Bradyrhizobium sp. CB82]|nr:transposase [Bradyrhizobium sp. CB82]WFU45598.1 transposase [Bradyrhizobium sp. CB82]